MIKTKAGVYQHLNTLCKESVDDFLKVFETKQLPVSAEALEADFRNFLLAYLEPPDSADDERTTVNQQPPNGSRAD